MRLPGGPKVSIQAVLLAGDRGAAKAVRGRSKAFVEVAGRPMVVHVLEALLHTPEVSEVFVTGNAAALERVFTEYGCLRLAAARCQGESARTALHSRSISAEAPIAASTSLGIRMREPGEPGRGPALSDGPGSRRSRRPPAVQPFFQRRARHCR